MSQSAKTAKEIFLGALDAPKAARGALLDDACSGNPALRRQVEALLQVHDEPDSLLDRPRIELGMGNVPGTLAPTIDSTVTERPATEAPGAVNGRACGRNCHEDHR